MNTLKESLCSEAVIPSVTSLEDIHFVLKHTALPWICLKMGDINSLASIIALLHKNNRKVMVHQDSIKGIAKDKEGIAFLKRIGADAIITMKSQNLKMIREGNILAVLGAFIVDSSALAQTVANIKSGKPDAVLIMPMTVPSKVYKRLLQEHDCILAGGLGAEHDTIQQSLDNGSLACIVSDRKRITETYLNK